MSQPLVTPASPQRTRALGNLNPAETERIDLPGDRQVHWPFQRAYIQRQDLNGVVLGPYLLGEKLGEGGMGTLFHAYHQKLGKACVIKFIHPTMATNDQAISRFLQEIRALGQLNHPHIVCALDAGCCDGVHYYVTELLEGYDLQRWVATRGPLTFEQSCGVMRQILDGLGHAHRQGFVHRDIKPSNIFLTHSGHAKLLDFGLVRNARQNDGLTSAEQLLGTLDYVAPEQAEDPTRTCAASDLYSLGLTWIFSLSGQSPFPDAQYTTSVSKLRGHLVDQPAWLSQNASRLSPQFRGFITTMIVKDPHKRFQSCDEVLESLNRCASPVSASALTHDGRSAFNRRGWIAGVGLVATVIAMVSSTVFLLPDKPPQLPNAPRADLAIPPPLQPADSESKVETTQTLPSAKGVANARVVHIPTAGPRGSRSDNSLSRPTTTP